MKYSLLFGKTNRTAKEFDSINATLLQKAGYIDQVMAGVYTFLPLGLRVLSKIENIVRDEMNKIASEVLMPSLSPRDVWAKTGRLEKMDVMMQTQGANPASLAKNDSNYILNATHEEIVTPLASKFTYSYKQLPLALYQIQTKFRNEPRAKSGLLRCREFRMKDLYSFHKSPEDLKQYYEVVKAAYNQVFKRVGLGKDTFIALASGGDFTDDYSHEFQTKCESGEDLIFHASKAQLHFNREIAPSQAILPEQESEQREKQEVLGEGIIGVEDLAKFLNIDVRKTTKTLFYQADDQVVAVALRGDYEVNELKLKKILKSKKLELATAEAIKNLTGAEVGYAGILNLPDGIKVVYDDSLKGRVNFETGANKTNYHIINVNFGRDLAEPQEFHDIKLAKEGDIYYETGEVYEVYKASEVGNIFPLYTKFSDDFNFHFTKEDGSEGQVFMGCYGIGTSRIMGVVVEKFHDEKGIIWPINISPFHVHLIGLNLDDPVVFKKCEDVHSRLKQEGLEVLFDDRVDVKAGSKFNDAELIGIPNILIISAKTSGEEYEFKTRNDGQSRHLRLDEIIGEIKSDLYS
ncbi:MAG TPA: proline--tRNA ligase [Candidatus Dojkabacteria bacterium]|nr:proline--tRNA ligase [Candidatus Dojkabacteria bacterium]